ncbi:hypothetical protein FGO68_gene14892 [Halteria grandinella]|uniref:Uncharacterized protein n=1 Tax=Halteria grandinella TaxID=5974 RepID=A0A8J8T411_HALGN|nr:hypothetical protein FGO68_gene14892 [Halteria grandinella]
MQNYKHIIKQELGALFDDDDDQEIPQKQIEAPPIQKTAFAPPLVSIKKEQPKQQKQEPSFPQTPSLSSENFLNTAQSIITDCDRVFALIERTASANKEQALKIKNQTKQIAGVFESKIQSLLKNEHCKSSIAQKETDSLIMKNEAHLTSLKYAIGSLEQQIKQIEVKIPKKKAQQGTQIIENRSFLKQHNHEKIRGSINLQQIIDDKQRKNIEFNGFCDPYFSLFDRLQNQTQVYHRITNQMILCLPIKQKLLTANNTFIMLGMTPYFLDKDKQFRSGQELGELREKIQVTPSCAEIIQQTTLILGFPNYTRIQIYDLTNQHAPRLMHKHYLFCQNGFQKTSGINQIQESKLNSDSILIQLKKQIVKVSLLTMREIKNSKNGLPHEVIINVGNNSIIEFRQVEDQYLAVLTSASILIVDQFLSQVLLDLKVSKMDQILPCPGFSIDERPWIIQINDGKIWLKDITGKFQETEIHQQNEFKIVHIIGQAESQSTNTLLAITQTGQLVKSCLNVF